jgi:hypothetical protein
VRGRVPRRLITLSVVVVAATTAPAVWHARSKSTTEDSLSGCFRYSVRTDRGAYRRSEPVTVIVTATNIGTQPCPGRSCGGLTPWFEVYDMGGRSAYRSSAAGIQCRSDAPPPAMIAPGQAEVWAGGSWDKLGPWLETCQPGDCNSIRRPAATGWYRITWHWRDTVSARTGWFELSG